MDMDVAIVRTTRSQRIFSSWAPCISSDRDFDFVPALYSALFSQEQCGFDSSFMASPLDQDVDAQADSDTSTSAAVVQSQDPVPKPLSRKAKFKSAGHKRRKRRKKEAYHIDKKLLERFPENAPRLDVDMSFEEAKVTSTAFVALNDVEQPPREYSLDELVGEGSSFKFKREEWNGLDPRLVVDKNGIICAILAGHPDAKDWPDVHRDAAYALKQARLRSSSEQTVHRRGAFATLLSGYSHGGGQRFPMNFSHRKADQEIVRELNSMECFVRMANFASAVMARQAPALYSHYDTTLQQLEEKDPSLCCAFPCSVFAAVAYNLGPKTVCYPHKDPGNFAGGMCSVMPAGTFNPKKGGHLVLWECGVVVKFPPGSTILLPSAVVAHSNTSISPSETRYSFTQYSAGGLFRWVNNGFKQSIDFRNSLSSEESKQAEQNDRNRWKEVLTLLPRVKVVDQNVANNGSETDL